MNREGFHMSFGCYYTEEEAAKAYDRASIYEVSKSLHFDQLMS